MGADYMRGIQARARMLARACRFRSHDVDDNKDNQQMRLPFNQAKAVKHEY